MRLPIVIGLMLLKPKCAFSTFFTAIVVWLILLWNEKADEKGHERYLLIIAYMIGLATGLHLLNLLAIPFITLIIYFRKYKVCLLYTSPSPRDGLLSRMPSSA